MNKKLPNFSIFLLIPLIESLEFSQIVGRKHKIRRFKGNDKNKQEPPGSRNCSRRSWSEGLSRHAAARHDHRCLRRTSRRHGTLRHAPPIRDFDYSSARAPSPLVESSKSAARDGSKRTSCSNPLTVKFSTSKTANPFKSPAWLSAVPWRSSPSSLASCPLCN